MLVGELQKILRQYHPDTEVILEDLNGLAWLFEPRHVTYDDDNKTVIISTKDINVTEA